MKKTAIALTLLQVALMLIYFSHVASPAFEVLDEVDKQLTMLFNFNGGPFLDAFFRMISKNVAWGLMGATLLYVLFSAKRQWREAVAFLLCMVLVVAVADQISASVIKPLCSRLRPSHTVGVSEMLHYVNGYHGGRHGFVSSHAANALGVSVYLSMTFRKCWLAVSLALWSLCVCYSRIYLGVHYLGDIIGGGLLGATVGLWGVLLLRFVVLNVMRNENRPLLERTVARHLMVVTMIWASLVVLVCYSWWVTSAAQVMHAISHLVTL